MLPGAERGHLGLPLPPDTCPSHLFQSGLKGRPSSSAPLQCKTLHNQPGEEGSRLGDVGGRQGAGLWWHSPGWLAEAPPSWSTSSVGGRTLPALWAAYLLGLQETYRLNGLLRVRHGGHA